MGLIFYKGHDTHRTESSNTVFDFQLKNPGECFSAFVSVCECEVVDVKRSVVVVGAVADLM